MLTDKERNEIDPEFCCRHLLGISSRLTNELSRDEQAAIFGAVSLIKDQSVDEWCFGIKQRRNGTTGREKVIKGLECCLQTDDVTECQIIDCPYHHWRDTCTEWLMKDAVKLLKEQEAIKPYRHYARCGTNHKGMDFWYNCGSCKAEISENDKYCHECGQAVKWDE